jgi:hypothetical protein
LQEKTDNASERISQLESRLSENCEETRLLREMLQKSAEMIAALQAQFNKLYQKTFTTCVQCHTEFDFLTHHYSIGLHDNLVFVKCPNCRKDMAIDRIDGLKRE